MPASVVFETVTVAVGDETVWFTFEWEPGNDPNRGPIVCMASPNSGGTAEAKLVVEEFATCRHGPPKTYVFYSRLISNLGTTPIGARILAVYFSELQGDWGS
jgi:hypothetical protein